MFNIIQLQKAIVRFQLNMMDKLTLNGYLNFVLRFLYQFLFIYIKHMRNSICWIICEATRCERVFPAIRKNAWPFLNPPPVRPFSLLISVLACLTLLQGHFYCPVPTCVCVRIINYCLHKAEVLGQRLPYMLH